MSVQEARKSTAENPRTLEEARAFVKQVESLFMPWNVEGIVAGFTEDCALMGDTIANTWEGEWEDSRTGARMAGYGVEIWKMRGGRIAAWEAAFNVREAGKSSAMGIV